MAVGNICVHTVDTARADESVWTVAERMHQRGVGAIVVVDGEGRPIGIVTDRDIVERAVVRRLDADNTQVGRIMTHHPRFTFEHSSVESALISMRNGSFRRLPVVDAEGKVTGMLSLDDILRKAAREFAFIEAILKSETPCGIAQGLLASAE